MAWFLGIGVRQVINDKRKKYLRFKAGAGLWGYLTLDYPNFENLKYNLGVIGVLPILGGEVPPP